MSLVVPLRRIGALAAAVGLLAPAGFAQQAISSTRVSVATDGTQGNSTSGGPNGSSISADGRYVAFFSNATNLVSGDTNAATDVFVRDTVNNTTTRVSVATDGTQANNSSSFPTISADGRYVAFISNATNLVSGDTNGASDIFVRDTVNNTTTRVSVATDGTQATNTNSYPTISADGRYVAFFSNATNLVSGDTNGTSDIFVRDTVSNTTTRVSVATDGTQANSTCTYPAISGNGRSVFFFATATNLVSGDTNGSYDLFKRDLVNNITTRVNVATDGTQTTGIYPSFLPVPSQDGRYVAFASTAANAVSGDTNGTYDVFLRDTVSNVTSSVSVASDGTQANSQSLCGTVSGDGRYVSFYSYATNLVSGGTTTSVNTFVRDTVTNTTFLTSVASDGTPGNNTSAYPIISQDGRHIAFYTAATNFVSGDTNGWFDIYMATLLGPTGASLPTRFGAGALLDTQTRPTSAGDNLNELDRLYAAADSGYLRVGLTGNVASGKDVVLFLDSKTGGVSTLASGNVPTGLLAGLTGTKFDTGFTPDYAVDCSVSGSVLTETLYDLQTGTTTALGSVNVGTVSNLTGGTNTFGVQAALNNSNTGGVTDVSASNASTATTGLEVWVPLVSSGVSGTATPVKVMALLEDGSNVISSQVLPGLPDTYGALGQPAGVGAPDFSAIPGEQYATVGVTASVTRDLPASNVAFTYTPVVLTGSGATNATPGVSSPAVATPSSLFGGRTYSVDSNGNLVATNLSTGALDATFGTAGRVALDGPTVARPVLRSIGGVMRLFVSTSVGTLYAMDALDGGHLRSIPLGGVTTATPAVIDTGGAAAVFLPVLTAGTWYIEKVTDNGTLSAILSAGLTTVTNIAASPSVGAGGTRIQVGAVTGLTGAVFTMATSDLTIVNRVDVANPVVAPTTVSLDSATFFVGDVPATGNGSLYAFRSSNGQSLTTFGTSGAVAVSGGIDQAVFIDYAQTAGNASTLFVGTTTGTLYALRDDTGASALSGFPTQPFGVAAVTGGLLLVKANYAAPSGNLYVPTAQGLYVVPTATPTTHSRYPATTAVMTPSAAGRSAGSVVAATGANGNIYGFSAQ